MQFGVIGDGGLEHEVGDLRGVGVEVRVHYRGTSLIRNRPTP